MANSGTVGSSLAPTCPNAWAPWARFASSYIDASGRVIDYSSDRRITVSEGQAYALFFALVAGDRTMFERLLQWTEDNLSAGNLRARLPAWHWGRADDGRWGVLDANSASDADLWLAYTLAQAARVWGVQRYAELAGSLSDRLLRESTAQVPGLGLVLLPAPKGFGPTVTEGLTRVRLNPSYLSLSLIRWMSRNLGRDARWKEIYHSSIRVLEHSSSTGYVPDWLTVTGEGPEIPLAWGGKDDAQKDRIGSYDAIRVYLWLGLMSAEDPVRTRLLGRLAGMTRSLSAGGEIPERVDAHTGEVLSSGNPYLGWALLPYLKAQGRESDFRDLAARLNALPGRFPAYYEDAMMLFASGHIGRHYRFDLDGSLELARNSCSNVSLPPSPRLH